MSAAYRRDVALGVLFDPDTVGQERDIVEVLLVSVGTSKSDQYTINLFEVFNKTYLKNIKINGNNKYRTTTTKRRKSLYQCDNINNGKAQNYK